MPTRDPALVAMGKRIKSARKLAFPNQTAAGEAVGLSQSRWGAIERGESDAMEHRSAIARALGVRVEWIVYGEDPMRASSANHPSDPADSCAVDRVCSPAGTLPVVGTVGARTDGQRGHWHDEPDLCMLPAGLASVRVYGESAEPVIMHGQLAIIDASRKPQNNDLVVVESEDGLVCKRWCPQPDGIYVVLASPNGGRDSMVLRRDQITRVHPVVGVLYK